MEAVTPGGILAQADLVDGLVGTLNLKDKLAGVTTGDREAYDPDGRRRVCLTRDETKVLDRLLIMFQKLGIGMIYCCSQHPVDRFITKADELAAIGATEPVLKPGWKPRCLKFIVPEGWDENSPDRGYGCDCTRIHIRR